jgi:hypothetical protein
MSIRSQDLDTNALLLYPLGKGASSHEAALIYSLPQDDEDSDGGHGSALQGGEEEVTDLKLSLQVDSKEKLSNEGAEVSDVKDTNETSAAPIDPMVLPAGYGAAIIAAFLAMIKYLNEMAEQGYQVTAYSANAMIGTDNKPGLIQSWVDAGMNGAEAQGAQMRDEAIGALVSGALCGFSFLGAIGGFVKNSTSIPSKIGFENEYGRISEQLEDATSYKNMLDAQTPGEYIAQSESERVVQEPAAANQENVLTEEQQDTAERMAPMDKKTSDLKEDMIQRANTEYKANRKGQLSEAVQKRNEEIELAAKHLNTQEEKAAAKEKADKRIESLQNQLGQRENAQQMLVNTLSSFTQAGSAGGQAYGGWTKSQEQIEASKQKASGDALQQTSQTTEDVKGKATQQAQTDREQMGQMAQALAQALASQTQSRA